MQHCVSVFFIYKITICCRGLCEGQYIIILRYAYRGDMFWFGQKKNTDSDNTTLKL